jgi:hypothetical protein
MDSPSCFGHCRDCGVAHSLPSGRARAECLALMEQLRKHGRIDFETPAVEADPLLSTDRLYTEARGKMIGVLICEDAAGKEIVLRAFSSKYNGVRNVPGWAPPLMDEERFMAVMAAGNLGIHPLTDLIQSLEKGSDEWNRKVAERKLVSQSVLSELHDLYEVHNFCNEKRSLAASFHPPNILQKGIPVGTGDCCAPKLLNLAAKKNLRPISIAEFFWGRETASGQRLEGEFYSSCEEKCQPLLGFMLCGGSHA